MAENEADDFIVPDVQHFFHAYLFFTFFFLFFFFFLDRQYAVRGRRKAETSLRLRVQYQRLKIRHLNEI